MSELYLGGLHSLQHAARLNLTHFVTVLPSLSVLQESPDFQHTLDACYKRLHIPLDDADHADLLTHLQAASGFIQRALDIGGTVLVHCAAGISRSATVVTAHLMITEHMTSQEALRAVRQKAPWADPNPGFKHQLDLFAAMGHKLDAGYEPYQAMLLSQQRQLATLNTRPLPKQLETGDWVCKQCHRLLVTSDRVISTPNDSSTYLASSSSAGTEEELSLHSQDCILVKPQRWMGGSMCTADGNAGSNVLCPNCGVVVGSFRWASCSVPGIADLHTSAGTHHPLPLLRLKAVVQYTSAAAAMF